MGNLNQKNECNGCRSKGSCWTEILMVGAVIVMMGLNIYIRVV